LPAVCHLNHFNLTFHDLYLFNTQGRYAQECGLTLSQVAHLYIGYGVTSVTGRLVSGRICDAKFINPIYVTAFVSLVIGISIMFIQFAKDFTGLMLYFCIHGMCDGIQVTAIAILIIRNTHALDRTRAFGWFLQIISFGFLLGPPCGGKVLTYKLLVFKR
jgi:MFS family permease